MNIENKHSNTQRKRINEGMKMTNSKTTRRKNSSLLTNKLTVSTVATLTAIAAGQPAFATIDNSATAAGTYVSSGDTVSAPDVQSVPVIPAARDLSIVKTISSGPTVANGTDTSNVDAGDTITYQYVITNDRRPHPRLTCAS